MPGPKHGDSNRRRSLERLACSLLAFVGLSGFRQKDNHMSDPGDRERASLAEERERRDVERLYSTKSIRVRMGAREYQIPANYFGPKGADDASTFDASSEQGFGFFLFLPDYGGYTKENWRDPFDRRLIKILQLSSVDKTAMVPYAEGGYRRIQPEAYGEPKARFENRRSRLEEAPAFRLYGLEGYRWRNGADGVTWVGTRSAREFFFFESSLAPGEALKPGITYPHCTARYYSEQENLYIIYRYSQDHLAKWLEIDDAIWAKVRGWQVK